jgi:mono/diheme cytochrome c family protein
MFRTGFLYVAAMLLVFAGLPSSICADDAATVAEPGSKNAAQVSYVEQIAPLFTEYCTRCHGGARPRAGLALDTFKDEATALKNPHVWELVLQVLRSGEMPPRGSKPKPDEIQRLAAWVEGKLGTGDCATNKNPGRVTLRRLNRAEYNNTIRDLVGVDFQPADDFPADDVGYGFDNIGDVLSLPPLLMEKYLAAADKIVVLARANPQTWKRIVPEPSTDEATKEEHVRKILTTFARRAYRRPISPGETERLLSLVRLAQEQGDGLDKGIELAVQAVLASPHFLFRVERDRRTGTRNTVLQITDHELATRLSYFLWSSMPDDELFQQASQGTLRQDGNLEAQVTRMLNDSKARALVENFAGQWLQTRNLKTATPDPSTYPAFDEPLRSAMLKETELFFESVVREDRSILDFLDADFTFVNERLAKHYGISGVKGEQFQRVTLTGTRRGGVLTQASFLTLTSNPTRTSPVKRGKWILENILGTPPAPPPPDAPDLSEDQAVVLSGSLRKRMEQHRADPNCATCHERMDPLGFGFENFDGIGAWRTRDGEFAIDASGSLPGGQSFNGPAELQGILKTKTVDFSRCLTEKLLTYALGRGLEPYDKCTTDQIVAALAKNNYKFSTLVHEIVKSDPFQKRRTDTGAKP